MSLADRTISGVRWSGVSQVTRLALRTATIVVLARLLAPADFGIMSMAVVVTGFVDLFKELGMGSALIQRKAPSQRLLSTVFWTNVIFGFLAGAIVFGLAPLAATFYRDERVVPILQLLSLGFIISSLGVVQSALLTKQMAFKKLAVIEVGGAVVAAAVAIALAVQGAGVFSLVGHTLAMSASAGTALWFASSWRPSLAFAFQDLRSVAKFSANLVGFNTVNYFARNLDYVLIGRLLGAESLGYYTIAYNLLLFPIRNISRVISRVTYPAYALMQEDNTRLSRAYLRVVRATAMVSFPVMLGLLAICDVFVPALYGEQWSPAVPLVAIFVPVAIMQSLAAINGGVYQAKGRTDLQFRVGLIFSAIIVAGFIIGVQWGLIGVALAYASVSIVILGYPTFAIPLKLIGLKVRDVALAIRHPFAAGACMLAGIGLLRVSVPALDSNVAVGLPIFVGVGTFLYVVASLMINRSELREMWFLVRPSSRGIRSTESETT